MDSKLIYNASEAIKNKVIWLKSTPETEWIYIGNEEKANKLIVHESIIKHFINDKLYIVLTRKDSIEVTRQSIEKEMERFLGFQNFLIWDADFKQVIEFNKIGTMRCGQFQAKPN